MKATATLVSWFAKANVIHTIRTGALIALFGMAPAASALDGVFDSSFADGGRTTFKVAGQQALAVKVRETADGKIAIATRCSEFGAGCVVRLLSNGTFDGSYGQLGLGYAQLSSFTNAPPNDPGTDDIRVLPDGRIVAVGADRNGTPMIYVIRADGTDFDQSVGGGKGYMTQIFGAVPSGGVSLRVQRQTDGKFVVVGAGAAGSNLVVTVVRILPDLSGFDTTFGTDGIAQVAFNVSPGSQNVDVPTAVALQPDGKIVIGGFGYSPSNAILAVARLLANGQRDTTFGPNGDGRYHYDVDTLTTTINDLAIDPSGRSVFAGEINSGSNAFYLMIGRLTSSGLLDTSFDGGLVHFNPATDAEKVEGLVVTADSILTAGSVPRDGDASDFYFEVNRFDFKGLPVASFGANGSSHSSFAAASARDFAYAGILTSKGFVLAGSSIDSSGAGEVGVARVTYEHIFQSSFD